MTFRKILCPIDFSEGSRGALRFAARLAADADAELVLSHAFYVPPVAFAGETSLSPEVLAELSDDAERDLRNAMAEATALGAQRISSRMVDGLPWQAIVGELADPGYDLVVVGTHGRTGFARIMLGSVAEKVVRHAPCSVLVVRPDSKDLPFKSILCPVDFSDASRAAIDVAAEVVRPGGAGITLLHVVDVPVAYGAHPPVLAFARDLDTQAAAGLEDWAAGLRARVAVPVTTQSRLGGPGAQILHMLDEPPVVDLVVVGTHGRTGLSRVLLGSVAEKIVRHAHCPVLVARKRA